MTSNGQLPQRRIGLTGGIASGKSSVGTWLKQQGISVLDADRYAHEVLAPRTDATRAVIERYGLQVQIDTTDWIDRAALGQIVFHNQSELRWLEQLIHPLVRQRFTKELEAHKDEPLVVLMIPLLFENGFEQLCNETWVVSCRPDQQLTRLIRRNNLDEMEAKARISAQMPLTRKCELADHVIDNTRDIEDLPTILAELI
ncbi:dephospho-CoA kinase [Synechococcus sp. M16CYN]|uniref:dephospho-CoA kinase n=1 Tax=Synechococcus sp. M16CYN TaxID=3103139 RepID=UPI0030E5E980